VPKIDFASDPKHVFESTEVDQVPRVLSREPTRRCPSYIAKDAEMLDTTLMAIIDADGSIGSVRVARSSGNPTFDALMAKNILEWGFSPAMKGRQEGPLPRRAGHHREVQAGVAIRIARAMKRRILGLLLIACPPGARARRR
jgi:TonB family protein